jgi:hypothetical protein
VAEDLQRTLEEVVAGYEGGQATASLLGGSVMTPLGSAANVPPPDPVPVFTPPPPPVLPNLIQPLVGPSNPAMMVNSSTAYASNAMQPPTMGMGAGPVPMMATQQPMMPPPMPPMAPSMGQAGLFQQGMGMAQQNQIGNPMMAMYMSQQGGLMPDANMMMGSQYGNMRQDVLRDARTAVPLGVPGGGVGIPNSILPIDAFQRTRPPLQFNRGFDAALYQGLESSRLLEQGYNAYGQAIAGQAVNAVAAPFTTMAGAAIGGLVTRTAGGAGVGAEVGLAASQLASEIPGVTRLTQAALRPAIERRADAIQMQYASRQFMVGGGRDVDISGTGLSGMAAQRVTRGMDDVAGMSGGALTRRDAVNIMQAGGEQGLLDWAQNSDQIVGTVKTMSKVLGTFAEITGDPDFMNNIKKMGALSRMGIGLTDMDTAMRNMDQYARMAGMDVDQLMQNEGLQGAQMFKASGLSSGQGMQNRMYTAGQARQMVAGGAFTEQDLDLYGGTEGVGQTMAEINAAYLSKVSQPLMPFMLGGRDEKGNLTIDQKKLDALSSGDITYDQALKQGANSGITPRDLADMMSQMKELQAKVGQQMGPEGVQRAALQAAIQLNESTGGQMGLRGAAHAIYGEAGGAIVGRMTDANFQRNDIHQKQMELQRREYEADAAQRAGGGGAGFLARMGMDFEGPGAWAQRQQSNASDWLTGLEESRRLQAAGISRYSRGREFEGFSGTGGMRGRGGRRGANTTFDWMLGTNQSGLRNIDEDYLGGAISAELSQFGDEWDTTWGVFGDEAEMSRYLQGRGGIIGATQDFFDMAKDPGARREKDDREIRAYRLAQKGGAGLEAGRASLEKKLGGSRALSDVASKVAGRQGDSIFGGLLSEVGLEGRGREIATGAMMLNPFTAAAGVVGGVAQLAGFDFLGRGDTAMADERIAEEAGVDVSVISNLSAEEKGALIDEIKSNMTIEQQDAFDVETRDSINRGTTERIGEQYLRSGADAKKAMNTVLRKAGLDDYEDLSKGEKAAIGAIGGTGSAELREYMAVVALVERGETELANKLKKELRARDKDYAQKLKRAQKLVKAMNSDAKDALVDNIKGIVSGGEDMSGMSGADALKHTQASLAAITDAGEGAMQAERFAATIGKLADIDSGLVEGVEDDAQLADKIASASGEELKAYKDALGEDAVALARSGAVGGLTDEELSEFAGLTAQATGAEAGHLDLSSKRGATSEGTTEMTETIASQKAFFGQLNATTKGNTNALSGLTREVKNLTGSLPGSAEALKNQQRGSGKRNF